jgi:hypothetical protein
MGWSSAADRPASSAVLGGAAVSKADGAGVVGSGRASRAGDECSTGELVAGMTCRRWLRRTAMAPATAHARAGATLVRRLPKAAYLAGPVARAVRLAVAFAAVAA